MSDSSKTPQPPEKVPSPEPAVVQPGLMARIRSMFGGSKPEPVAEVQRTSGKGESRFMQNFQSKTMDGGGSTGATADAIPAKDTEAKGTPSSVRAPAPVPVAPPPPIPAPVQKPKEPAKSPEPLSQVPPPPPKISAPAPSSSAPADVWVAGPLKGDVPSKPPATSQQPPPPPPILQKPALAVPPPPPSLPASGPSDAASASAKAQEGEIASAKARFLAKHSRRPLPAAPAVEVPPAPPEAGKKPVPSTPVSAPSVAPTAPVAQTPPPVPSPAKAKESAPAPAPVPASLRPQSAPEAPPKVAPPAAPSPSAAPAIPTAPATAPAMPASPKAPVVNAPEAGIRPSSSSSSKGPKVPSLSTAAPAPAPMLAAVSTPAPTGKEPAKAPAAPVPPSSEKKGGPVSTAAASATSPAAPTPKADASAKVPEEASGPASGAKTVERRRARVLLEPMADSEPRRNWRTPATLIALLLLLGAAAVTVYYYMRETTLEVRVVAGQYQVQPKAFVVFNFAGKTSMLQRDFRTRQAPLLEQLDVQQEQLSSARGDLAGRQKRRDLLQKSMEQLQKEIPEYLDRGQKALDRFWVQEGEALKKEYTDFRESLHQEISDRAKQLGLNYQRNPDLDAVEVAANAFRLALYNAPSGVGIDAQRKWSEELLGRWNDFEKKWNEKQLGLKERAMDIKQEPGPKVEAAQERINQLRLEIDAMDVELQALKDEVATYEERLKEARQALEDTVAPFLRELLNVPGEFEKLVFEIPADGVLMVRELQERPDLPPGTYTLLVRSLLKEEEFWAVKDFTIAEFEKNTVEVQSGDFKPARQYLLGGK